MSHQDKAETVPVMARGRKAPEAPDFLESFAECVARRPDKAAAEFSGRSLSYAELDRATDRLASRLRELGVGPSSRVAVAMPRGFGELASLIATLKAGGAYVPLDASHPVERVRVVLEDAQPQVLIAPSDSPLSGALPEATRIVDPSSSLEPGASPDAALLPRAPLQEDQIAYILFTSGSTGRPKGVEVPRRAFANFLQSMAEEPGLGPEDRVLAITTTTFDIAGLELFLPLSVGATVVIADKDTARDPARLRSLFDASGITLMQATPATWRLLLDAGWKGAEGLRMLCGGEAMSVALGQRLAECGSELWNVYGPTETTVWSTLELIPRNAESVTIGHPIDNTLVFLRGEDGRALPEGEIGEICIGGAGLALGYRGRPDLSSERFLVDGASGERFYRTGDLGRFLPDGRLECLGRIDHQVKIRGFRVEPSDIEAQLRAVEGLRDVLVTAVAQEEGDPLLVAYYLGSAGKEALRLRAEATLPRYMVPSAYVRLESFPLTTSGKIDRKALPPPESATPSGVNGGTAPRNDRESLVAAVWREILKLPFVPVDEDFFSLGGTSLRAVLMRDRLEEAFGVEVSLKTIFDHPTVEGIVSHLGAPRDDSPIVMALSRGRGGNPWIGLMGIQLYEDIGRAFSDEYPFLAVHVPVRYVPGVDPFPSVGELARRYVEVIRRHQERGPYYLIGLCHGGVVAFEAAAQLEEAGEEVALVALLDAELPLARSVNPGRYARRALGELFRDPRGAMARGARKLGLGRPRPVREAEAESLPAKAIDLPFDGPEIDADLLSYQALGRRVGCKVLTFRATESDVVAPWIRVAPDLGWTGRAAEVRCSDIPSTHLGIVRDPFAARIVEILSEERRLTEGRRAEGRA